MTQVYARPGLRLGEDGGVQEIGDAIGKGESRIAGIEPGVLKRGRLGSGEARRERDIHYLNGVEIRWVTVLHM